MGKRLYTVTEVKDLIGQSSALLFDFDGTLINLDQLNVDSFAFVFKDMFNLDFSREDFMKYISGRGSRNGIVNFLETRGVKDFESDQLYSKFYDYKNRLIEERIDDEIYLIPGIKEYLQSPEIFKKRKIIVTSSRKKHVERMLTHFGIYQHFEIVMDRHDVIRGKPDPQPFLKGLEYLGLSSDKCIAFEDSFFGLQSSKSTDLFTVGVLNEGWNDDFVYHLSDFVISNYLELL